MKTHTLMLPLLVVLLSLIGIATTANAQCGNSGSGSLAAGDAIMNSRLYKNTEQSLTCGELKGCPGVYERGIIYYDTYTFTNTTSSPQCYTLETVHLTGDGNSIFDAVYLTSFNPERLCSNHLADPGTSLPNNVMVFGVPANTSFVVVFMSGQLEGTGDYSFVVKGLTDAVVTGIPTIAVSGAADCTNPVQLTGSASGNNFVITGPNGYVFSNVYRSSDAYAFLASGITSGGQYTVNAFTNGCLTASQTVTVAGTACGNKSGITPVTGKSNDL